MATGKLRVRLKGHAPKNKTVSRVALSPDGKTLASGDLQSIVTLWNLTTGKVRATRRHHWGIRSLAFSPDGKTLATTGGSAKTVKLWDVATGKERAPTIEQGGSHVRCVEFSPNGRLLAVGGSDGTVVLWDPVTRKRRATLSGHSDGVNDLTFSPDGNILATANFEWTVKLWNVKQAIKEHAKNKVR